MQAEKALGSLYPLYASKCALVNPENNPELKAITDEMATHRYLRTQEFNHLAQRLLEKLPEGTSFSTAQRQLAMVFGYRSWGLLNKVRQDIAPLDPEVKANFGKEEGCIPNLFIMVVESGFGSDAPYNRTYKFKPDGSYHLHYLDMYVESRILGFAMPRHATEEVNHMAQLLCELATVQTASLRSLKAIALTIEALGVTHHHTSLDITASAFGYKSWTEVKRAEIEGSVINKRIPLVLNFKKRCLKECQSCVNTL